LLCSKRVAVCRYAADGNGDAADREVHADRVLDAIYKLSQQVAGNQQQMARMGAKLDKLTRKVASSLS
jgi:phage shock protein A